MSAATVNGADAMKSVVGSGNKQQIRGATVTSTGKALDSAPKRTGSPTEGQNSRKSQTPKAWQGQNPITSQKPLANGSDRSVTKGPAQTSSGSDELHADRHAHDRSLFLFAQFVGKDAVVTLKNGEQITGVFSGGSYESAKSHYTLKMAKRSRAPSQQANGASESTLEFIGRGDDHTLVIDIQDTVDLFVQDVISTPANKQQNGTIGSSFMTDTQISGRDPQHLRERELQQWTPGPESSVALSLEDSGTSTWDQFATNERMYGVQTSWDENMYTTSIDKSSPHYKQRQAAADKIAREIEGSTTADAHVAEERRRDATQDDAGDEEDKYSGVRREAVPLPKRALGAYVPPSQRPITGAPTVHGAPFDPAIISSQIAKPAAQEAASTDPAAPPPQASAVAPPPASTEQESNADESAQDTAASTAAPKRTTTTEDHVRGTADAFKQFANTEKLRMRQAQEAKRSSLRQEKNVKLNDLKKFAANFKLTSRVPDDLVPILAKDREKQIEIQTKAEVAAKEEEQKGKDKESTGVPSPAPSASSTAVQPPPPPAEQRPPFNQHTRARGSQQMPRGQPQVPGQTQAPRAPPPQRFQTQPYGRANMPHVLPTDLRLTTPQLSSESPSSPLSATRFNAKAFEFRPAATLFTPSGTSPSPQRLPSSGRQSASTTAFFEKRKTVKQVDTAFDPLEKLNNAEYTEQQQRHYAANGGVPQAYNTLPTWDFSKANETISYKDLFPKSLAPPTPQPIHASHLGHAMSTMHPGAVAHMQTPPMPMPPRPYWQPQQQQLPMQQHFDPRMQHQHMPQYRASPNPQYRQPYPQPQHGFPGMPPPQFQQGPPPQGMPPQFQQGPPMMQPQFQGSPMPYRMSPNLPYRPMPGAQMGPQFQNGVPPPMQQQFSQQGYMR